MEKPIIIKNKRDIPHEAKLIDGFSNSIEELFFVRNPKYKKGMFEVKNLLKKFLTSHSIQPLYVYYPWRNQVVSLPPENIYFELRTARNKNLIPSIVQDKYRSLVVGIIGLSIGSAVINYLTFTGGSKQMKLADFDNVAITNLNRMHANVFDLGQNKTEVASQRIWEIDPFAELYLYPNGIEDGNIENFILRKPKLHVFIDAMDSLSLKVKSRMICKANKIPVIMTTSNGDGLILDVERFDIDQNYPIFHNRLGNIQPDDLKYKNYKEWARLATKVVGKESLTKELKDSLKILGKEIASIPQLASTVDLGGIALTYVLRKIVEDTNSISSGRYCINLKDIFNDK